jgi:hypothetical protein
MNKFILSILMTIATLGCVNASSGSVVMGDINTSNKSNTEVKKVINKEDTNIKNKAKKYSTAIVG